MLTVSVCVDTAALLRRRNLTHPQRPHNRKPPCVLAWDNILSAVIVKAMIDEFARLVENKLGV